MADDVTCCVAALLVGDCVGLPFTHHTYECVGEQVFEIESQKFPSILVKP